ncbi:MAG: hypothetical protein U9O64_06915, partial [Campylobacterota bacterium]|nr:hypothetical protein [Campylobacterota bacterium]
VDLELGYYYRKVIKNEEINYGIFVDYLVEKYVDFLKLTNLDKSSMVVKGLNLTVLKYGDFATSYIQRIITENIENKNEVLQAKKKLNTVMESYSARNNATLNFNIKLQQVCLNEGWKYFDVNEYLSDFTVGKGILDRFIPSGFDHHLCDSVEVRKMHLSELNKIQREMK